MPTRLTDKQKKEAEQLYIHGKNKQGKPYTYQEIAKKYKVCKRTIANISLNMNWIEKRDIYKSALNKNKNKVTTTPPNFIDNNNNDNDVNTNSVGELDSRKPLDINDIDGIDIDAKILHQLNKIIFENEKLLEYAGTPHQLNKCTSTLNIVKDIKDKVFKELQSDNKEVTIKIVKDW